MVRQLLQQALQRNEIQLLDWHTGIFLEKLAGAGQYPELFLAGVLASAAVGNGHVYLPLDQVQNLPFQFDLSLLPAPDTWRDMLLATPVVGRPGESTPLILDDTNRLYLYRFYQYEEFIAVDLLSRAAQTVNIDVKQANRLLGKLFSEAKGNDQKLATIIAQLKQFLVISGGPGTGKTYTMARILALAIGLSDQPLRIGLAAPTGKAAARMEESIRTAKQTLPAELADRITEQANTLHRLLGYHPGTYDFRYNEHNQLPLDLLVVDEASMIDVPMMNALLLALPKTTRLILLGDRNQLASVEAGSLFSDLCQKNNTLWSSQLCKKLKTITGRDDLEKTSHADTMGDSVVLLRTSYRFHKTSGLGKLSAAVNSGDTEQIKEILSMEFSDVQVEDATGSEREKWLIKQILKGYEQIFQAQTVEQAFTAMEQFRFLCTVRRGPSGIESINTLAEKTLRKKERIEADTEQYPGRPIIIRRNNYAMQLFNGDTGLLWNDVDGKLKAWFRRADNTLYPLTPTRLPEHDTAYAITIHKAQGSEFEEVLLLLPEEENRILSRELIYTGITRARKQLILCSNRVILLNAIKKRTCRHSGLAEKLWPTQDVTTKKI